MAEQMTLARPYAKAVFNLATSQNRQADWARILTCLSLTAQDSAVARLIGDPTIEKAQLIELFNEVCDVALTDQDNALNKLRYQFICLLTEEGRLNLLLEIADLYHNMQVAEEGLVEVDVTSAFELDDDERKILEEKLTKRFSAKVDLTFHVDESIIGGLVVRAGNWVMDGSVKGKLAKLSETLTSK
ncbi:MAG: ATP synthase F1 subunit delta [Gammaproteobacteria bacterium RIFCSPHIGHO2_12_FULL_41_15]|nr:MAG: ATP synthase F1 subunit delta [Gammaproteobacteria bacterium RIFCSPHIGHO2_12_FULL_41_15]